MKNLKKLETKIEGHELYMAGIPTFARNFTRDAIISSLLMEDADMLKNQLIFCAKRQGKRKNGFTGEEPGKIFHEYPAVIKRKMSPEFNACDTTALFLIGHEAYQKLTLDKELAESHKENIKDAIKYIKNHLKKGGFYDSPSFWGAKRSALHVTYWKDSEIVDRDMGIPAYPVSYFLAQVQNLRGMKSAFFLTKDDKLKKDISDMRKFLNKNLYDEKEKRFFVAIDKKGPLKVDGSDPMHALFYLDEEDIPEEAVEKIVQDASTLETPYGYRALSEKDSYRVSDPYHAMTLWPFEQAMINIGARKFRIKKLEQISSRILKYLTSSPEIFDIVTRKEGKVFKKGGCDPQLWTIAAREYFKNKKNYKIIV